MVVLVVGEAIVEHSSLEVRSERYNPFDET